MPIKKSFTKNIAEKLKNIFSSKEIRGKIFYVLGILLVLRVLNSIPVVGIKADDFKQLFAGSSFTEVLAMGTGAVLEQASVLAIGLAPYINASIFLQLMSSVIPKLKQYKEEGAEGRRKISMITRYLTIPLAILQSFVVYSALRQGITESVAVEPLSTLEFITMISVLTGGATLMMWLGELISESGIGGGTTVLIFYGIVANVPYLLTQDFLLKDELEIIITIAIYFAIFAVAIYINEAQRKIDVFYSRRVRSDSSAPENKNYIPFKFTQFGVMPVIFATSLFYFPQIIGKFILTRENVSEKVTDIIVKILQLNENFYFQNIGIAILVILFAFFYVSMIFNVDEQAESLQKQGAFIRGVRPGKETADYLRKILYRLTSIGAVFLALFSVLPNILTEVGIINVAIFSGTGLFIIVSAVMDLKREIEAMAVVRSYDKYL